MVQSPISGCGSDTFPRVSVELHQIFGVSVSSLAKTLLPQLFGLFIRPAVGRVLVDLDFFHMIMMEICELSETNEADIFSSLVQISESELFRQVF